MARPVPASVADEVLDRHDSELARAQTGKDIGRGARWMGISQVLMQLVRIGSVLVLATLLTETDFGLVSLVTIITTLFDRVLGDTGTTAAIVRSKEITQGLVSSVLWLNITVGTISTLGLVVFATPIASLLGEVDAANLLRLVAVMAVINSASYVPRALLRRRSSFKQLAIGNMLNAFVTAVVSIVLALLDWNEWSIAVGNLAGAVVGVAAVWAMVSWRPSRYYSGDAIRSISKFSANLSLANLFGYLSFAGDRFIVGRFLGVAELGFYGMANRLMRYPVQTASQTYRDVVFPSLARLQDDPREVERVFGRSVSGIAFLLFPLCAGVAALARPLVDLAMPDRWAPAADILSIIAVTSAIQAVSNTTGSLYNSRGRSDLSLRWQIGSSIVLVASYAIGANWGLAGVAWGYLIGTTLLAPIAFYIGLRLIGARVWATLRPTVVTGLAAAATGWSAFAASRFVENTENPPFVQLVVGVLAGAIVYIGWAAATRPAASEDFIRLITKRKS